MEPLVPAADGIPGIDGVAEPDPVAASDAPATAPTVPLVVVEIGVVTIGSKALAGWNSTEVMASAPRHRVQTIAARRIRILRLHSAGLSVSTSVRRSM